jgi:NAD(P)H-flavin reductase
MSDLTPWPARLAAIDRQVPDHYLFTLLLSRPLPAVPGQFVEISVPGVGGFPASLAGLGGTERFEACIRRTGRVTDGLYRLREGDVVGLRGPLGHGFPLERFWGRDVLLLAGGLGIVPLRGLMLALLAQRPRCGRLMLLYGTREPELLLFRAEFESLARQGLLEIRFAVDFAVELPWQDGRHYCRVGLVTELLDNLGLTADRTAVAVCGPPVLYSCVLEELAALGIPASHIFATLERRMKCGIGQCCHCVTGGVAICREGPVFSLEQLRRIPGAIGGGS